MSEINIVIDEAPTVIEIDAEISAAGPAGPANQLSIGSVTSGPTPSATITGEAPVQVLDLVLAQGDKGDKGDKGDRGDVGPAGSGSGDMLASVYDPGAGARQVAFADEIVDPTFAALEGNVADNAALVTALGAKQNTISLPASSIPARKAGTTGAIDGNFAVAEAATPDTVVVRSSTGNVKTATPTAAADAATKAYTDAADAAKANDADVVKLTGAQTVAGVKTFSASPVVPAPTTDTQASTKKYVDDSVAAGIAAAGSVAGPASSTTNAVALYSGTTGKVIKNSGLTFDAGDLVGVDQINGDDLPSSVIAGVSDTQTLTGKRIDPRIASLVTASANTPSIADADIYSNGNLGAAITINNPTGSPAHGSKLTFILKDNGTTRNITWGAKFIPIGATLPTKTTANKWLYVGAIYNSIADAWHVIAVSEQV